MGIALTLQEYLSNQNIDYEVMTHKRTNSSLRTAQASHVPDGCLAKGVVLTREGGYVMVVLPASCRVRLDTIEQMLHCPVGMATEDEVSSLFPDCEPGAVPPIGAAYAAVMPNTAAITPQIRTFFISPSFRGSNQPTNTWPLHRRSCNQVKQ